jgi:hypothetical protein
MYALLLKINMKLVIVIVCLAAIIQSCHNDERKLPASIERVNKAFNAGDSTYLVPEKSTNETIYSTARPATFVNTPVYTTADTLSEVTFIIPPFTFFEVLSSEEVSSKDTLNDIPGNGSYVQHSTVVYFKVRLFNGREGFIVNDNIADFTFKDDQGKYLYMVGDYSTKEKDYKSCIKFLKYDVVAKKIVAELRRNGFPGDMVEVNQIRNLPLKNVSYALHLYAHGDYCGGSQSDLIVVDTPTGMTFLPMSFTFFDDGGGIDRTINYIPAVNGKGKSILYANADTRVIDTTAYFGNMNYPLSEVFVMKKEEGQEYRDDENDPILLKNGNIKMEHHSITTAYYHWDGRRAKQFYVNKLKLK